MRRPRSMDRKAEPVVIIGRFHSIGRDDQGKLYCDVDTGAGEISRCMLSQSGTTMSFAPRGYWYTSLMTMDGRFCVELRGDDYYQFRAHVVREAKISDLFM